MFTEIEMKTFVFSFDYLHDTRPEGSLFTYPDLGGFWSVLWIHCLCRHDVIAKVERKPQLYLLCSRNQLSFSFFPPLYSFHYSCVQWLGDILLFTLSQLFFILAKQCLSGNHWLIWRLKQEEGFCFCFCFNFAGYSG